MSELVWLESLEPNSPNPPYTKITMRGVKSKRLYTWRAANPDIIEVE